MSKKYTIKSIEWKETGDNGFTATVPFGTYYVDEYIWSYCFDEIYDRDEFRYNNKKENGKKLAEAHWIKRLEKCLKEIK